MKAIIVDDDPVFTDILEEYIKASDRLTLNHSFLNPVDALKYLKKNDEVEVVFLDVKMPRMSGLDFSDLIKNVPYLVMMSSERDYAADAFDKNATDFLHKPVDFARFMKTLQKIENIHAKSSVSREDNSIIFIRHEGSLLKLLLDDVIWIQANQNYVDINTFDEKYTILNTMHNIQKKLPANIFHRIHRSHIINKNHIKEVSSDRVTVTLASGDSHIPARPETVRQILSTMNIL